MASGAEIYRMFQSGQIEPLRFAFEIVEQLSKEFEVEAKELGAAHKQMMEYWEGDSADAAGKGVMPLIEAHAQNAPLIENASSSMTAQAESFSKSKNSVVPVPDEPAEPSTFAKFAGTIAPGTGYGDAVQSYRDGMAAHEQANANNVRVMGQYTASTDGTRSALPSDFGVIEDDGAVINVETRASNAVASPTAAGPSLGGAPGVPSGGAPLTGGGHTGGPNVGAPGGSGLPGGTTSGVQQPSAPPTGTPGTPGPPVRPGPGMPIAGGPVATPIGDKDTTRSPRGRGTTAARPPAGTSRAGSRMTTGVPKANNAAGIQRGAGAAAKYSGTPQPGKSVGVGNPASGASTAAAKGATAVGRGAPGAMAGTGAGRGQGNDDEKEHKDKYAVHEQLDAGLVTEVDELGEKVIDERTGTTVVQPVIGDDGGKG
ncbi:MAG: PPE domain-containing protein [Actinophytocola sp.]|nr:PPE domain-containing protein [Actinophytocola sp.]